MPTDERLGVTTVTERAPAMLELRQYLLRAGRRDDLIELFDRELVETQEAAGMRVVGQFRDVDRVNHFVWLRGFPGASARVRSLAAFYGGAVWKEHGPAAIATMIDSDDVLLLRVHPAWGRALDLVPTSRRGAMTRLGAVVILVAHRRAGQESIHDEIVLPRFDQLAADAGLTPRGVYETDPAPNGYPALPVHQANCAVWIGSGRDAAVLERSAERLVSIRSDVATSATQHGVDEIQIDVRRLVPTGRSTLAAATSAV